jgi:Flp pilus assembly protein TadG
LWSDRTAHAPHSAGGLVEQEDGVSLVEFAVSLTLLLTLIFCFMELCLVIYTHHLIAEMAREGTHYASEHGASCPSTASPTCEATYAQVNSYVSAIKFPNLGGGTITVTTGYASSGSTTFTSTGCESVGCSVKVTVGYVFPIAMPFVANGSNSISMSAVSVAVIQQ